MEAERVLLAGEVLAELRGPDGELKASCVARNVITDAGDQCYGERGSGIAGAIAAPTGMKLGTGAVTGGNLPAKSSTGAVLAVYLTGSNKAFDGSGGIVSAKGTVRDITYKRTYAAGEATTASPITEAIICNDSASDATSSAANTYCRVALAGIGSKGASDTLTLTWKNSIGT